MRNLSISNLILIMHNSSYDDKTRILAERELKYRAKKYNLDFDDIVNLDYNVILNRGLDIDNYLISDNVDMQMLMEYYFNYSINSLHDEELLFSEKHLCNKNDKNDIFFTNICTMEMHNIEKRLETERIWYLRNLIYARNCLEERIKSVIFSNSSLVDSRVYGLKNKGIVFDENEDANKILENKFILEDSSKLKTIKNKLALEAICKYAVNYNSNEMTKALKK